MQIITTTFFTLRHFLYLRKSVREGSLDYKFYLYSQFYKHVLSLTYKLWELPLNLDLIVQTSIRLLCWGNTSIDCPLSYPLWSLFDKILATSIF